METPSSRVAVVTGAGRGIGRAIALALAGEGMQVVLLARTSRDLDETARLVGAAGGTAVWHAVDITDAEAVERVFDELGPVDLLVNVAGSLLGIGSVWEIEPADWWTDVEVNVRGTYLCIRGAVRGMRAANRGRVVNLSSSLGKRSVMSSSVSPMRVS